MSEEINISLKLPFYLFIFLFLLINKHFGNIKQQIKTYLLFKCVIEISYTTNCSIISNY